MSVTGGEVDGKGVGCTYFLVGARLGVVSNESNKSAVVIKNT